MITDMLSNKNLNLIVAGLLIRGRKVKISHVFVTQSYFALQKIVKLKSDTKVYFIIKIQNKQELQKLQLTIHQILPLNFL